MVAAWSEILSRVPGARLLLKSRSFHDQATRKRYVESFARHGIDHDRLEFAGHDPKKTQHLGHYGKLDIALDPFPYNGTTTTCEALWMGVPVVTYRGPVHAGRVGSTLLSALGLETLIAGSKADYVATAVKLAGDREALSAMRANLRQRMIESPLCDAAGLSRAVEKAYREMWQRWCALDPKTEH